MTRHQITPRLQQHRASSNPEAVVWFISFGDLLTLLLCFFLVLTPWDQLKKRTNAQSLPSVNGQSEMVARAGTALASDLPLRGSVMSLELPLFEEEGGLSGNGLSPAALSEELKRAMPSDGRIEVLVCSDADHRATVVRYVGEALERSFGSAVPVRFIVRRACDLSQVRAPITKQVVGRIRIVGT